MPRAAILRNGGLWTGIGALCTGSLVLLAVALPTPWAMYPHSVTVGAFLIAVLGLVAVHRTLTNASGLPGKAAPAATPTHVRWLGVGLALVWCILVLPPQFRFIDDLRSLRVYSLDEPIMLQAIEQFVHTPGQVPTVRLWQGWITFLPVALLCKAIDWVIPVNLSMINMLMRFYLLAVWSAAMYWAFVLVWRLSRSTLVAIASVIAAFWFKPVIDFALRIDRPDGFNLLFLVLSILATLNLLQRRDGASFFWALFWAAMSFAARFVGMVMLPTVAAVYAWIRWQEAQAQHTPMYRLLWSIAAPLTGSAAAIFVLGFVAASPYHVINFQPFLNGMIYYDSVYKSGNAYNLPDYRPPSKLGVWWDLLTQAGSRDALMLSLAAVGFVVLLVWGLLHLRRGAFPPYMVMVIYTASYIALLLYQHGGDYILYHYAYPVLIAVPFFVAMPVLEAANARQVKNPLYACSVLALAGLISWSAIPRLKTAREFLVAFRQPDKPEFAVGRFLDHYVPYGSDPKVLSTWWVHVPPRISSMVIYNVSFTLKLVEELKPDLIVISHNFYDVYADKYAPPEKNRFYPGYNVYYNDVVEAYTRFKAHSLPDFTFVATIKDFDIFERTK